MSILDSNPNIFFFAVVVTDSSYILVKPRGVYYANVVGNVNGIRVLCVDLNVSTVFSTWHLLMHSWFTHTGDICRGREGPFFSHY